MLSTNRQAYLNAAPRPEGWVALITKMRELLKENYDWSADVERIAAPTLVLLGDADTLPPAHGVGLFELLGGGKAESAMGRLSKAQLAILPSTTHFNLLSRIDLLLPIITGFLEAPMPAASAVPGR